MLKKHDDKCVEPNLVGRLPLFKSFFLYYNLATNFFCIWSFVSDEEDDTPRRNNDKENQPPTHHQDTLTQDNDDDLPNTTTASTWAMMEHYYSSTKPTHTNNLHTSCQN